MSPREKKKKKKRRCRKDKSTGTMGLYGRHSEAIKEAEEWAHNGLLYPANAVLMKCVSPRVAVTDLKDSDIAPK
jgi:hypothetical protein